MTTEVLSNTYSNGKRVSSQRVTYDKSDDLFTLANLYRRLENLCSQIAAAEDSSNASAMLTEKTNIENEIAAQEIIVNGYSAE